MVVGAMGQSPALSQFVESIIFNFPAQVAQISDDQAIITIQVTGDDPDPMLFFVGNDSFASDALVLLPAFPRTHHSHRLGVTISEAHLAKVPNFHFTPIAFSGLAGRLASGQGQGFSVNIVALLLENGDD